MKVLTQQQVSLLSPALDTRMAIGVDQLRHQASKKAHSLDITQVSIKSADHNQSLIACLRLIRYYEKNTRR